MRDLICLLMEEAIDVAQYVLLPESRLKNTYDSQKPV